MWGGDPDLWTRLFTAKRLHSKAQGRRASGAPWVRVNVRSGAPCRGATGHGVCSDDVGTADMVDVVGVTRFCNTPLGYRHAGPPIPRVALRWRRRPSLTLGFGIPHRWRGVPPLANAVCGTVWRVFTATRWVYDTRRIDTVTRRGTRFAGFHRTAVASQSPGSRRFAAHPGYAST